MTEVSVAEAPIAYPRGESFYRYAAASCGMAVVYRGSHEAVSAEAELTLFVHDPPAQNTPERRLRAVRVQVNAVRSRELAIGAGSADRPFEGVVKQSDHKKIKRGHNVIGLISRDCEALLLDTTNTEDMEYLISTFNTPQYRQHVMM